MPNDTKVSALTAMVSLSGIDLLHIIDDPAGVPTNKKITLNTLFGNIPCNTSITGEFSTNGGNTSIGGRRMTVTANSMHLGNIHARRGLTVVNTSIRIANTFTPANSTQSHSGKGTMFWDENYLYMETANSIIKRLAWSSF